MSDMNGPAGAPQPEWAENWGVCDDDSEGRLRWMFVPAYVLDDYLEPRRVWSRLERAHDHLIVLMSVSAVLKDMGWLPPEANVMGCGLAWEGDGLMLMVEDASFDVVAEGEEIPAHVVDFDAERGVEGGDE